MEPAAGKAGPEGFIVRKMLLLAGAGLILGLWALRAEAQNIRDRDAATQLDVARGQRAAGASPAKNAPDPQAKSYWFLPGFVQPYGYPIPEYEEGNNSQTYHTGR